MKKEFNEFFEDINIDELTNIWNLAKAEKIKRRRYCIINSILFMYWDTYRYVFNNAYGNSAYFY